MLADPNLVALQATAPTPDPSITPRRIITHLGNNIQEIFLCTQLLQRTFHSSALVIHDEFLPELGKGAFEFNQTISKYCV